MTAETPSTQDTPESIAQPFEAHPALTAAILDIYHHGHTLARHAVLLSAINDALETERAAERERCAGIADYQVSVCGEMSRKVPAKWENAHDAALDVAQAIRDGDAAPVMTSAIRSLPLSAQPKESSNG